MEVVKPLLPAPPEVQLPGIAFARPIRPLGGGAHWTNSNNNTKATGSPAATPLIPAENLAHYGPHTHEANFLLPSPSKSEGGGGGKNV